MKPIITNYNEETGDFRVCLNEIYALRIDDITFFADQNKMTFEYDSLIGNGIIFKDIKQ